MNWKYLSLILIWVGLSYTLPAQIIYVKVNGTGDGSSWQSASGDLVKTLKKATFGTQIWVAQGTYTPSKYGDRNQSFILKDGVKLYGGFKGIEKNLRQRNPHMYPSILSGEIGSPSIKDNSYTVIYTENVSAATVLDGFHLISGYAQNWEMPQGHPERSGAGWYNNGSTGSSNPVIRNCYFSNNWAVDGGGIYNNGNNGRSKIQLINCHFIQNIAVSDGGAIYNGCHKYGVSKLWISNTHFESNESNNGAAIFNFNVNGLDEIKLDNCHFLRNTAFAHGGAIFDHSFDENYLILQACQFEQNYAEVNGENIYSSQNPPKKPLKPKKVRVYKL